MGDEHFPLFYAVQELLLAVPDAPLLGLVKIFQGAQDPVHSPADVRDVKLEVLLLLPLLLCLLLLRKLCPELLGALLKRSLDGRRDLVILSYVLLARPLEGNFGAHYAHKDPDSLLQADLVLVPLQLVGRPGDDIVALLEQQRDPVRKPEHVQLVRLDGRIFAPNAHRGLHNEGVALQSVRSALVGRHHVGVELLHDSKPQVVLSRRGQVLAIRVREPHLLHEIVQLQELAVVHLPRSNVELELGHHPVRHGGRDVAEVAAKEL
mmetsp:Transcript_3516/g.9887  ORF Transcript_3516/g.9887 Transcript_3516/m.9887 type:complete len:264 (-) Transcript_3516:1073-1864(-)